jgi:hypothetical protein
VLSYRDVEGYLKNALQGVGYGTDLLPMPFFDPGPGADPDVQDQVPDMMVVVTVGGGSGLDMEEVFDRPAIQIRSIGPQADYDGAEKLAYDLDRAMVAIDQSQSINGKWTLIVVRAGGAPSLLLSDDGDRYHFTCNYIWEVEY